MDEMPACSASISFCMASGSLSVLEVGYLVLGAQVHAQGNILFFLNYKGFQLHRAKSEEDGVFPLPSCGSVGTLGGMGRH